MRAAICGYNILPQVIGVKQKMKAPKQNRRATNADPPSPTPIDRIKEVLAKIGRPVQLAAAIGVSESRIYEYTAGKRQPTPEGWLALGKLALNYGLPDPFFFWARAGVDRQSLESMANKIIEGRSGPLVKGEIIRVPRFRYTERGREEAGAPVPFAAEFVPDPANMICVIADEKSTALLDCPRGAILLDTSCEGTETLQALWNHVVLVERIPGKHIVTTVRRPGIYAGRLHLEGTGLPTITGSAGMELLLTSLIEDRWTRTEVGRYDEPKGMEGVSLDDYEAAGKRWMEVRARAISAARLYPGFRVIGEIKGRISGRISRQFPATFA